MSQPSLVRPMRARDPHEHHRVATPLELLFDLCFVVAIAEAGSCLHHAYVAGHAGEAIASYARVFFAIWWAWMNFTWLASSYDNDDVPYRLLVLLQIVGVLILAAGVPRAFEGHGFAMVAIGYVVMRIGVVALWLRVAHDNPDHRPTALRYALGIVACQVGWVLFAFPLVQYWKTGWMILVPLELLMPMWAERPRPTPWHPHHISERYGLMTLIVLGESVLAATTAIQRANDAEHALPALLGLVGGGVAIVVSMWWLYFDQPTHRILRSNRQAFIWGYGHYFVFAAIAALGAGLAANADLLTGQHVSEAGADEHLLFAARLAVTAPVTSYVLGVWLLIVRPLHCGVLPDLAFVTAAALTAASTMSVWAVPLSGLVCALLVVAWVGLGEKTSPVVN